jgi:hypothetical protein
LFGVLKVVVVISIKKYLVIFLTVASLSPLPSVAERMALVIGNQAYTKTGVLVQPIADAELMVKAFQSRKIPLFEGKGHFDLTSLEMEELLVRFAAKIRRGQYEAVLVYYAGHGAGLAHLTFMDQDELAVLIRNYYSNLLVYVSLSNSLLKGSF